MVARLQVVDMERLAMLGTKLSSLEAKVSHTIANNF